MTRPPPALRDFSDRVSPIVVKELRHGLRTSGFTLLLMALHALLMVLMCAAQVNMDAKLVSLLLWSLTAVLLLGALPLRGIGALNHEIRDGTLEMLALTGLTPARIVWGKWQALYSQTLLTATTLLPYLVVHYHKGGVELVHGALALAMLVLGSAVVTAAMVGISWQRTPWIRLALAMLALAGGWKLGFLAVGIAATEMGHMALHAITSSSGWSLVLGSIPATAWLVHTLLGMAVTRVAPEAENHTQRKRQAAFSCVIPMSMLAAFSAVVSDEVACQILDLTVVVTFLVGLDITTEPMPTLPRAVWSPDEKTWMRWLMLPGWASGVLCYGVLALWPALAAMIIGDNTASSSRYSFSGSSAAPGGWWLCVLMSVLMPVCLPVVRRDRFFNTVAVILFLAVVGLLMARAVFPGPFNYFSIVLTMTPVTALMLDSHESWIMAGSVMFGLLWMVLVVTLAVIECRTYRELEAEAAKNLSDCTI